MEAESLWSTNIAIGRFTARLTWNICSSTSRLGFSRSMRMTSGSMAVDVREEIRGFIQPQHLRESGLAQPVGEDRRPHRVFVDDHDFQRGSMGARQRRSQAAG